MVDDGQGAGLCGLRSQDSESRMFFLEVWLEREEESWVIAGGKLILEESSFACLFSSLERFVYQERKRT